jgi:hypothetical protein
MTKDKALKMAIEALKLEGYSGSFAYKACKEALKQPTQEWQGLSDDDIKNIFVEYADLGGDIPINACYDIYCDIEQKLKEKNS